MKHTLFTDEIGNNIVALLKIQWDKDGHRVSYTVFDKTIFEDECYAPVAHRLNASGDIFGLLFQGYSGTSLIQEHTKHAKQYLDCLLDPKGPFKGILPYLWHSKMPEVIKDKGFVFKDLAGKDDLPRVNMGLLWTFAQATRLMYESPHRMKTFLHAAEEFPKDKPLQLFVCFSLQPSHKTLWESVMVTHGEPLGNYGIAHAGRFLSGTTVDYPTCATVRSWRCFGKKPTCFEQYDYKEISKLTSEEKTLSEWVTQFQKERKAYV